MIELLFIACMANDATACQEQSLIYQDLTPMACVMAAQPELAKWAQEHPNFRIASWKCRPLKLGEREA